MSNYAKFLDLCLSGNVLLDEIDDFVDRWHETPEGAELHDYLGMTKEEYSLWLHVPDVLPYIIKARRQKKPLKDAVADASQDFRRTGQSGDQSKISRLQIWLKTTGEFL